MESYAGGRAFCSTAFLIGLLTLCACGSDDNPLAPGKGAILMDYLPLEGNSQSYRFNMSYSTTNNAPEISYESSLKSSVKLDQEFRV